MPMWTCDFEQCSKPAVRNDECILCSRHLCSSHSRAPFHECPPWEDEERWEPAAQEAEEKEIEALYQKFNKEALVARASDLRNGIRCAIPVLEYKKTTKMSIMGGMNYHVEIVFEDGVVWLARIRRSNVTSPPPALRDYIFQSEFATMKFLEETALPTPKVFDFALESNDNPIGVGYILIEKMAGTSLQWPLSSPEQKRKVVEQLADIYIELRKYSFDKMGSLDTAGSHRIGAFAHESRADFNGFRMLPFGPLSSLQEYYSSSTRLFLDLIIREEMYSQNPIDAYLIHRFLLDLIPSAFPFQSDVDHRFFLKHADDKGDHILVDKDYNITAIIDWEWAYTAPEAIAFNSPMAFLPVKQFHDGLNSLGKEEKLLAEVFEKNYEPNLAQAVRNGRLHHQFAFCCGYNPSNWNAVLGLFKGLRDAVSIDQGLDWEEWRQIALERYHGDDGLKLLLSKAQRMG